MSPGATFERVYREIKRQLAEGTLPPGTPVEPALLTGSLAASITPIRDALHRLTGERLVEAPRHNGFLVPRPTEAALRDLYTWNAQLLGLAARHLRASLPEVQTNVAMAPKDVVAATSNLFVEIARTPGSGEHLRAVQLLNDRLAPFRRVEAQLLDNVVEELEQLILRYRVGDRIGFMRQLDRYHRRRIRAAPEILYTIAPGKE